MKKVISISILFVLVFISCKTKTNDAVKTHNQSVVQDLASMFSPNEKDSLTSKIIDYEASSSNEICVYTLDSLPQNTTAIYYATQIANTLGVGKKDKNNGLLILISKYDRELAISTGYATEKVLTDYKCKVIIDSIIVPKFKNDEFYNGINNALDEIILQWQ